MLVPGFARGGRIGESFIGQDGGAIRNVVVTDRAGIRSNQASFTLAHEVGHVLLDDPGHPDDFGIDLPSRLSSSDPEPAPPVATSNRTVAADDPFGGYLDGMDEALDRFEAGESVASEQGRPVSEEPPQHRAGETRRGRADERHRRRASQGRRAQRTGGHAALSVGGEIHAAHRPNVASLFDRWSGQHR